MWESELDMSMVPVTRVWMLYVLGRNLAVPYGDLCQCGSVFFLPSFLPTVLCRKTSLLGFELPGITAVWLKCGQMHSPLENLLCWFRPEVLVLYSRVKHMHLIVFRMHMYFSPGNSRFDTFQISSVVVCSRAFQEQL